MARYPESVCRKEVEQAPLAMQVLQHWKEFRPKMCAELEKDGVIVCRHGAGSFVAEALQRQGTKESLAALAEKMDSILTDAVHLNLDLPEVLQLIAERHAALQRKRRW